jgi:hypothetical protein
MRMPLTERPAAGAKALASRAFPPPANLAVWMEHLGAIGGTRGQVYYT